MNKPSRAAVSLIAALSLLAGCQATIVNDSPPFSIDPALTGPIVVKPPGIESTQTAEQVMRRMLDEIHDNERRLGRVLAPAQIVRVQLLRPGEMYPIRKFDGSLGGALGSPDGSPDAPAWIVEAIGTFPGFDRGTGELVQLSIHSFHVWDDAHGESVTSFPCWQRGRSLPTDLDGHC